jgi:hypothetical protein
VAIIAGIAAATVRTIAATHNALNANGFGVCDGHTRRPGVDFLPLTDWMEVTLRDLAGVPTAKGTPPVCFRDLWGEPAATAYRNVLTLGKGEAAALSPATRRALREARPTDCLVMTTDLNHGRPYRFPFDTAEFFWCPRCFADYFPDNVIDDMARQTTQVSIQDADTSCPQHNGEPLLYMPLAPDIPLVLAARISLSFPFLISAVPLYAIDWAGTKPQPGVVTVWFSDGGMSSNFPMRFFDVAWPQRPTFGINLVPAHPAHPQQRVWRPKPGARGRFPRYVSICKLGQFAAAILDTMQNWSDSTQITMPGFRDRVVEIRLGPNEGGMNMQMPTEVIDHLARRGAEAGQNILDGDPATQTGPFDFQMHRWMRYRNAMASLDEFLARMHIAWPEGHTFLNALPTDWPHFPAGEHDRQATEHVMELAAVLATLGHPATEGHVPHTEPDLRLVPPL